MTPTEALLLTPSWSREDLLYVRDMCASLKVEPSEFFPSLIIESKLNPAATIPEVNGSPDQYFTTVGLPQFVRIVAIEFKWIEGKLEDKVSFENWKVFAYKFSKMTVAQQLPYVREFFMHFAKDYDISKAYRVYQCIQASSTLGYASKPGDIIHKKGTTGYLGNKGLDLDTSDDGITINDLKMATDWAKKQPLYEAIMRRMISL